MITDIRLQHFRSYEDSSFELSDGVNIIVGPNASGKTNLLEAVLMIARGASYRARDAELVCHGADWARLDADTENGRRTVKLQRVGDAVTKQFVVGEQQLARLMSARQLPVVLFEPDHLLLLSGSPELRRTFLDDLVEQLEPDFGPVRRHYRRVLAQRNALLKKPPHGLAEQLFVWNLRLSELGGQIARRRLALIAQANERLGDLYANVAGTADQTALAYVSRLPAQDYESAMLHKLESGLSVDLQRGFTAYGPHRDDMQALIGGQPMQDVASRGEVRTLVLALKILELQMLEARAGRDQPMLLLDDVFSELDGKRRQALTRYVRGYQTFITTTDADVVLHHFANTATIIPME